MLAAEKQKERENVRTDKNKLRCSGSAASQAGSTQVVFIGVALIAAALVIFGFLFFSRSSGDSSSVKDGSSDNSSAQTQTDSATQTEPAKSEPQQTKKQTQAAVTEKTTTIKKVSEPASQISVHFIDCGQGDATLVISNGEAMLIDSGERDDSDKVIKYIKEQGVKDLTYVIVTHPHTDHMGEMPDILKAFRTENFIMPKVPDSMVPTIMRYEKMLRQVKAQGLDITWSKDDTFTLGNAQVKTFTPKKQQEDLNNYSTLVKISCGASSFLITGDCERAEEEDILSQKFDLSAKVLKIAHHGSYKASSYEFLEAVRPEYAVISCGKDNDYGHPHEPALKRIRKKVANLFITKDNGNIVFTSDGKTLGVTKQRG